LFRIRGIQLSVHFTFLLLLAYVAWEAWREGGALDMVVSVVTLLAFFACIVLHELGHSFVAKAFGVIVPRILLLPIGGMAEFRSLPRQPSQEILIALAGPAVNFAILALLWVFIDVPSWNQMRTLELTPMQVLFTMNLTMGVFNLLPAFPMDGGRVLRASLANRLGYLEATRVAALIAKFIAFVGVIYMAFVRHNPLGSILFVFIMIVGEAEYRAVRRQEIEEARRRAILHQLGASASEPPPLPLYQ
jgi:Zn-dependent protease